AAPRPLPLSAPRPVLPAAPPRRSHPPRIAGRLPQAGPLAAAPPSDAASPALSLHAHRDRPAGSSDPGGRDFGWIAACAGLLLAAGLLGMTPGPRRRSPRLPGWAFSLAKWQGKTPNPARTPRG